MQGQSHLYIFSNALEKKFKQLRFYSLRTQGLISSQFLNNTIVLVIKNVIIYPFNKQEWRPFSYSFLAPCQQQLKCCITVALLMVAERLWWYVWMSVAYASATNRLYTLLEWKEYSRRRNSTLSINLLWCSVGNIFENCVSSTY